MRSPRTGRHCTPLIAVALTLTAAIAGCAHVTTGEAAPAPRITAPPDDPTTTTRAAGPPSSSSAASPPGSSSSSSSPSSAGGPLTAVSPCALVGDQDRAQLGLRSSPRQRTLGYSRSCEFSEDEADLLVGVAIFDTLGPDKDVGGAQGRRAVAPIGRHQAQRWMFAGLCTFSLAVSATSTVDATAEDIDGDEARSCDTALLLARLVEPKLP